MEQLSHNVKKRSSECALNQYSDQPAHSRSLIIIFTGNLLDDLRYKVLVWTMKTMIRLCGVQVNLINMCVLFDPMDFITKTRLFK